MGVLWLGKGGVVDSWCLRCCCLRVSIIMGGGKCGAINGSYGFRDNLGGWK